MGQPVNPVPVPGPWQQTEIALTADLEVANPYTDVDVWADFTAADGTILRRPGFYDGGGTWRIRFAAPTGGRRWTWRSQSFPAHPQLEAQGALDVGNHTDPATVHTRHGFWRMSPGGRSLIHADGTPSILIADTAWALPWRATTDDAQVYAADRAAKGFNAVLLMSMQPDMRATGPRDRTADEGFDVAFEDLPSGHLNHLNPAYFQYFDLLIDILAGHGIVPVLQPVFQGFGWKGLGVAGIVVPPAEYARYCRYLVARYGARPAIYLPGADGSGYEPQIEAGGREIHDWDCYGQPTGIHYRPHGDNRAHQDQDWLDFQWCQTGHGGEHVPERVADMRRNTPVKAVANGEPTYEHTRSEQTAAGWWQGHEAWSNLCAGGTMGVVYGAANIWQWKLHAGEPGHAPFFTAPTGGWRESLDLPGSTYVGLVGRILSGLPTTDMEPDWTRMICPRALATGDQLYIAYQENGGPLATQSTQLPSRYRVVDPRTGAQIGSGSTQDGDLLLDASPEPRVIIFHDGDPAARG